MFIDFFVGFRQRDLSQIFIVGFFIFLTSTLTAAESKNSFHFVTLGDTAYNGEKDYKSYRRLISAINDSEPAFSIHVGDTWGASSCDDDAQLKVLGFFNKYNHPLIYTPGDNEWTDCIDPDIDLSQATFDTVNWEALSAYQLDRLKAVRRIFFSKAQTLGKKPRAVVRQSDVSDYKDSVENFRWDHKGVLFVTLHVVGSANNLNIGSKSRAEESINRNQANIAWIKSSLDHANQFDYKAVVFSLHGSLFENSEATVARNFIGNKINGGIQGPYTNIIFGLTSFAKEFAKPMLVIHGDYHRFVIDRPFLVNNGEHDMPVNANITRLQVYGAPEIKAVKVMVEPETPWVFSFSPLYP